MFVRRFTSITFIAVCLLLLPYRPAAAKPDSNDSYAVEVVVFANTGPDTSDGELWVGEHLPPNLTGAVNPDTVMDPNSPLNSVVDLLTASPDYQVLYHNRWIQTVGSKAATPREHITNAQTTNPNTLPASGTINGYVRLFRTRFMVLNVDVAYRPAAADTTYGGAYDGISGVPNRASPTFVLDQNRRVAAKEIHYFDHPKFGMLVYITQAPTPTTAPAAAAAPAPAPAKP